MTLRETFGCEGALDDLLVCSPVEEIEEENPGKEGGPVNGMPLVGGDTLQVLGFVCLELCKCIGKGPVSSGSQKGEKRDEETTDQKADSVEGVRYRYRTQASEDRVGGTNYPDEDDGGPWRDDPSKNLAEIVPPLAANQCNQA